MSRYEKTEREEELEDDIKFWEHVRNRNGEYGEPRGEHEDDAWDELIDIRQKRGYYKHSYH